MRCSHGYQKAIAIANEIELRLEHDFGLFPTLENRNGDWIVLDYTDFVVHIFLAEQRAFATSSGVRKTAKSFTPAEFDKEVRLGGARVRTKQDSAKKANYGRPLGSGIGEHRQACR